MVARLASRLREQASEIVSWAEKCHEERETQWNRERESLEANLKESREKAESLTGGMLLSIFDKQVKNSEIRTFAGTNSRYNSNPTKGEAQTTEKSK